MCRIFSSGMFILIEGLLVVLLCVRSHQTCLDGWTHDVRLDTCYIVVPGALKWKDAREYCREINAHLLQLTDWTEQEFINKTLTSRSAHAFWLGARINWKGKWEWTDHQKMDPNWYMWTKDSHPFGDGILIKDVKCLALMTTTVDNGKLEDLECDHYLPFMCEAAKASFPQAITPTTANSTIGLGETTDHLITPATLSVVALIIGGVIIAVIVHRRRSSRKASAPKASSSQEDILDDDDDDLTATNTPSRVEFSDVVIENSYEDIDDDIGAEREPIDGAYENVVVSMDTNDNCQNKLVLSSEKNWSGKMPRRKNTPRRVVVNKSYDLVNKDDDSVLNICSPHNDPGSSGNVYYLHPVN